MTLMEMIDVEASRLGSITSLADAMGVSLSRLVNVRSGKYPLDVEECLGFAVVSGRNILEVLKADGRSKTADLLASHFAPQRPVPLPAPLSDEERDVLERWKALTPPMRDHLSAILKALTD